MIDAHQHFIDFPHPDYAWIDESMQPLRRAAMPDDLEPILRANGVDGCVAVQARESLEETRWLLGLAEQHGFIRGVVGWVDLAADDLPSTLAGLRRQHPHLVGVRNVVQDKPDPDWLLRPEVLKGLEAIRDAGLTYDLLIRPLHMPSVPRLAQAVPGLDMVLDHIGKPDIKAGSDPAWHDAIAAMGEVPGVHCKLSGMITEADHDGWTADHLEPFVRHTVACFGYDRLMFGSDWPVCRLAGEYDAMLAGLRDALGPIDLDDADRLFDATARRFYGLESIR
ncbi:MAG: amidohydrolase family protein [Planctomycetota bacterium]